MPDVTLNPSDSSASGVELAYRTSITAADDYFFNNNGRVLLHVKKGAGADTTITIVTPGTVDGLAIADRVVVIATDEEVFMGPFAPSTYNNSEHQVQFGVTGVVTDLEVGLIRVK